jgi:protein gp37
VNRSRIEWTDFTWNPVTGCYGPGGTAEKPQRCAYCYAWRMAHRFHRSFEPEFHPERLDQPHFVKKPARIFVCSAADLFGDWMDSDDIQHVINAGPIWEPRHTYIFLTKNPKRLKEFNPWPANAWVGTTVTNQADANERLPELLNVEAPVRFVSIEPMLGPVDLKSWLVPNYEMRLKKYPSWPPFETAKSFGKLEWSILGAMTGPGAVKPDPAWVQSLIDQYRATGVPLFLKDNLKWPEKIQEWQARKLGLLEE